MKARLHLRAIATLSIILFTNIGFSQCWLKITTGLNHSVGIKEDGTLWAWGFDGYAQLGNGTDGDADVPMMISSDTNWADISAGQNFSMAVKTDETLWGWGTNSHGEVGDGSNNDFIQAPVQVGTDNDWLKVSAGHTSTVAIKTDGTLWAWGQNNVGQVGDGTFIERKTPVQISTDTDWNIISAGFTHSLAIRNDGTLWAWGDNGGGQLGDGTTTLRNTPVQAGNGNDWTEISAAQFHSKGIRSNGTLWSWGIGLYGLNGDGIGTESSGTMISSPTQIGSDTNWSKVKGSFDSAAAIKTDGTLYTWGKNDNGQLGDGTYVLRNIPVLNNTAVNCTDIAGGNGFHYFALQSNGSLWSWGLNVFGQIGDNTETSRIAPITLSCMQLSTGAITDTVNFSVYPNPVNDIINVETTDETIKTVEIYDMVGNRISCTAVSNPSCQINLSHLANAVYIVKIYTERSAYVSKVVKRS